jgi:hypothetical protein
MRILERLHLRPASVPEPERVRAAHAAERMREYTIEDEDDSGAYLVPVRDSLNPEPRRIPPR